MDFDNKIAIYIQIMDLMKRQMINGDLTIGQKIPSVRNYSKELKVNPTTIQRAYRELEAEGYIESKRGMGSFVTQDAECINRLKVTLAEEISKEYIEKMLQLGFDEESMIDYFAKKVRR